MRYSEFNNLNENASCGASSSPFFSSDPKATAEKSIYGAQSSTKKTKKKPVVIRRND
jgi:hypothetical protein